VNEFQYLLPYVASLLSLIPAVFVLLIDRKLFIHRIFAVGMMVMAVESLFTGLCLNAVIPEEVLFRISLRNLVTAMVPGIWFIFSLSFSASNYRERLSSWKWVGIGVFILPMSVSVIFRDSFYVRYFSEIPFYNWTFNLGWPGYIFQILILSGAIMVLINIERILRNSTGRFRWQIKFMILGIGCIFAARIYTISQTLLFNATKMDLELVNDAALIIGSILVMISLYRTRHLNIKFYMSDKLIYNSISILFIGIYFIAVGALAQLSFWYGNSHRLPLKAFFVLLALVVFFILFLSGGLKKKLKRTISRHLKRPVYDYQKEWANFTHKTTSVMDIRKLSDVGVKIISNTFDVLSVTIWILNESGNDVFIGASTVFNIGKENEKGSIKNAVLEYIHTIKNKEIPIDIDYIEDKIPERLIGFDKALFDEMKMRYCIPLSAGGKLLGLVTLYKHESDSRLTIEDFDLLKTMADQLASSMLNLMLSERLKESKQMETFQSLSAFLVHDLKNLASNLSLTVQNLPKHFNNPEYRNDALEFLSHSVDKIRMMCARLTSLSQKVELDLKTFDLNEIVNRTLFGLNGVISDKIMKKFEPVPKVDLDSEQIQKVIVNLVLNAHEATGQKGEIFISTSHKNSWVLLTVQDNGHGISRDFMEKSLFHPFKTTKYKGMGIGIYHSKMIVEAHHGKIEVESEPGKGSIFRVFLPVGR
jgi:putative PEP-CTERM system histidine kinase